MGIGRALALSALLLLAGCDDAGTSPCEGVTCSGLGECALVDEVPRCLCDPGSEARGLDCVADGGDGDADLDECRGASECQDESYCDGEERCAPGEAGADERGCAPGEAIDCDDGNPLTVDTCSEALGRCTTECADDDDDGYGSARCVDGQGDPLGEDCDDSLAAVNPGALEVCDDDALDEDCDLSTVGELDADGDGYVSSLCCNVDGAGALHCGPDCDDSNPNVNPGLVEVCDVADVDEDCDGQVNEGLTVLCYLDLDDDGYAAPEAEAVTVCPVEGRGHVAGCPEGTTDLEPLEVGPSADCDDEEPLVYPGAPEQCDRVDDDCDGLLAGEAGELDSGFDETDRDGDGFLECARGFFERDCGDDDPRAFPGQRGFFSDEVAVVGGYDFDCNGIEEVQFTTMGGCWPIFEEGTGFRCEFVPGWAGTAQVLCGDRRSWVIGCEEANPNWAFPCFNTDDWSDERRTPACR